MEETLISDSVKERLRMQNEVLKWLEEFSEKLHQRAKDTVKEVDGLLDQAGMVELDLKNTSNCLWNLSRNLVIDHKISDEDNITHTTKDHSEVSAQTTIPAQDYEKDILPRYKKALSLALSSCKNHLRSTGKYPKAKSIFRTGSAYGPLPHIIGSEEFLHDNSCGITENLSLRSPQLDFDMVMKSEQASLTPDEPPDLFIRRGSSGKDIADPVASAASDFKAMLEAALLNPYKFYDEEILPVNDFRASMLETGETLQHVEGSSSEQEVGSHDTHRQLNSTTDEIKVVIKGNVLPDTHAHDFYSALVGGSLFDIEEDLLSSEQKDSAESSPGVAEANSCCVGTKDADELPKGVYSPDINEAFCYSGKDNLTVSNEEETEQSALEEANFEKVDKQKPSLHESDGNGLSEDSAESSPSVAEANSCRVGTKATDELLKVVNSPNISEAFCYSGKDNLTVSTEEETEQSTLKEAHLQKVDKQKSSLYESDGNGSSEALCDKNTSMTEPRKTDGGLFDKDEMRQSLKCNIEDKGSTCLAGSSYEDTPAKMEPFKSNDDACKGYENQNSSLQGSMDNESSSIHNHDDIWLVRKGGRESGPEYDFAKSFQD